MSTDAAPTITEFLLARIAEDEAAARAALPVPDVESPRWLPANLKKRFGIISGYEVDHIARHDPARVLRECEAKRAIIEQWDDPAFSDHGAYDAGHARAMDDAVRALAAVYADHPDYRQEWAARG